MSRNRFQVLIRRKRGHNPLVTLDFESSTETAPARAKDIEIPIFLLESMSCMNGSIFIEKLTGSWPVFPVHPLVVATVIMEAFPDFDAANKPTGHGCCAALGDQRIPGAGDHVGAAMRVLQLGAAGASAEAMIKHADEYWTRGGAGGHSSKVAPGSAQALAIEPAFRERARRWLASKVAAPA